MSRHPSHQRVLSSLQRVFLAYACERVQHASYDPRPTGLMIGAETGSVITMEVFVEQDVVPPVRIILELPRILFCRASDSLLGPDPSCSS